MTMSMSSSLLKANRNLSSPRLDVALEAKRFQSLHGMEKIRRPLVQMTLNQIYDLIKTKLLGGYYHSMKHAFKNFSTQGNTSVTKCALYRLLCNYVPKLTLYHFNSLLKRINLDQKKLVSFQEFFSKFHILPSQEKTWQYPFTQHPKTDSWQNVHLQLKEKARNSFASLCSSLHCRQGVITKTQFKRFLVDSSFHLDEDQFECLWKKYDQGDNGWITLTTLFRHLGINSDVIEPVERPNLESMIPDLHVDNVKVQLLKHLKKLDPLNCGKVSVVQLCSVLSKVGINLTMVEVEQVLLRLGLPTKGVINYQTFVDFFANRKEGSAVHLMLTDKSSGHQKGSIEGTENCIVNLLQSKFLKLVASLRSYDGKNTGYIEKDDFRKCVKNLLSCEDSSVEEVIAMLCGNSGGHPLPKVPYPKFLAMFESTKQQEIQCPLSCRPLVWYPSRHKPLPKVQAAIDSKLLAQITHLVIYNLPYLTDSFIERDENNTGRLTFDQTLELLLKCGIITTKDKLSPLWDKLLKNRDCTVNFQQFIKEFSKPSHEGLLKKRLTDRDEDRILEKLQQKLINYHDSLLKYFKTVDPSCCGYITLQTFQLIVKELCPIFTDSELSLLISKYREGKSLINYQKMLSFFGPVAAHPFQHGNNLRCILSQQDQEATKEASTALPLASKPNHGLPGIKGNLQRKLTAKWKELRRLFKNLDSAGSGFISVTQFKGVLEHCNIMLDSEQYYHIMEALDPYLSGQVNYQTFINSIFDQ